jgi:hypothetical protein
VAALCDQIRGELGYSWGNFGNGNKDWFCLSGINTGGRDEVLNGLPERACADDRADVEGDEGCVRLFNVLPPVFAASQ